MKRAEMKLFCLSMLVMLLSITRTNAKDLEHLVYNEYAEMISEAQYVDLASQARYDLAYNNLAASVLFSNCYELKRVWVWSGWFPKRVWKWVKVSCRQAAPPLGPGTTIPPH